MPTDTGDYTALMKQLCAARGRDLPGVQYDGILALLNSVTWREATRIVSDLTRKENLPHNLLGAVHGYVDRYREMENRAKYRRENWPAKDQCLSSEEWSAINSLTTEIIEWHRIGRAKANHAGYGLAMSVDEWIQAGRPVTWSPLLDSYLQGSERAYKQDISGTRGALLQFTRQFLSELVAARTGLQPVPLIDITTPIDDGYPF